MSPAVPFVFLFFIVNALAALYPDNPCPDVFQYGKGADNAVVGKITVPFDGVTNKLRLSVNASLIGVYNRAKLGLQLLTPKDSILGNNHLNYEVYFPFQDNLAKITQIVFNGNILCSGSPYAIVLPGSGVTNIWSSSEYTINTFTYPVISTVDNNAPGTIDNNFGGNPFFKPGTVNVLPSTTTTTTTTVRPSTGRSTTTQSPPSTTQAPPSKDIKTQIAETCGLENQVQSLILNGENSVENQYPWVVAIMVVSNKSGYLYKCTANLITDRHVLTAAQCVQFYKVQIHNTEDILLVIGKSDLNRWATSDAERRTAKKVTVHPDYTQFTGNGDLCVIEFWPPVRFQYNIRPICLWADGTNLAPYVNKKGRVCGYGQSRPDEAYAAYRAVSMPIVSQEQCLRSNMAFQNLTSETTFCAGDRNGAGPCVGDSGAGLVLKNDDNRWTLRGIVSIALKQKNSCKLDDYVVFCDVAKYMPWIQNVIGDN